MISNATKEGLDLLKNFMPSAELSIVSSLCHKSEERDFFIAKVAEYAERIKTMPTVLNRMNNPEAEMTAYLHYFRGGMDFYITERDISEPDNPNGEQIQAYGWANLGYGGELGYISVAELIENGVELDLHFTPKKLSEVTRK